MAQIMTIEQAQAYLREHEFGKLRVLIRDPFYGERNATLCNGRTAAMVLNPRSKHNGYLIQWEWILKVWLPKADTGNQTPKFIKEAKKAGFVNDFIEKCLAADPEKGPYANGLTTGVPIEGKCITIEALRKDFEFTALVDIFFEMFRSGEDWHSSRYRWRGYDMSLWVWHDSKGRPTAGLNMEYKDCGNGYYYELINEQKFIGVDID